MSRILAIDYGMKRCGLAVTDPLQLSINPLPTTSNKELLNYVLTYLQNEEVSTIAIGDPKHKDGNPTYLKKYIDKFVKLLEEQHKKELCICFVDESYSSSEAKELILEMGIKKSKRRDKSLVDQVSAMLILKRYLNLY